MSSSEHTSESSTSSGSRKSRKTSRRVKLSLVAVLVAAIVVGGMALNRDRLSESDVAIVDGTHISYASYAPVMRQLIGRDATGYETIEIPDPPMFKRCSNSLIARGAEAKADALKAQCQSDFDVSNRLAMRTVVALHWFEQEAADRKIQISPQKVTERVAAIREKTFPEKKSFDAYLSRTGQTDARLRDLMRGQLAQSAVEEQVMSEAGIPKRSVAEFYEKHRDRFKTTTETRDVRLVFTGDQKRAKLARSALDDGAKWQAVARKFSEDRASRNSAGLVRGAGKFQFERGLAKHVFSLPRGKLVGPVKHRFGYYVLQVDKISRPGPRTFAQSQRGIRQFLLTRKRKETLERFRNAFVAKWRAKTTCREALATDLCENGPRPKRGADSVGPMPSTVPPN